MAAELSKLSEDAALSHKAPRTPGKPGTNATYLRCPFEARVLTDYVAGVTTIEVTIGCGESMRYAFRSHYDRPNKDHECPSCLHARLG